MCEVPVKDEKSAKRTLFTSEKIVTRYEQAHAMKFANNLCSLSIESDEGKSFNYLVHENGDNFAIYLYSKEGSGGEFAFKAEVGLGRGVARVLSEFDIFRH